MICPVCKGLLIQEKKRFVCSKNHSFDLAASGYLNLLLNQPNSGDNAVMIAARDQIMNEGYFEEVGRVLSNLIQKYQIKTVLDVGCGTGYYADVIQQTNSLTVFGVDISKAACKIAAKNNKHNRYIVSSMTNLPFENQAFDALLSIFAPLDEEEFYRVTNQYLIKVIPNPFHLKELKECLYEEVYFKENKPSYHLFEEVEALSLEYMCLVDNPYSLFQMTPYYYKTKQFDASTISKPMDITFSVTILVYKKKM